MGHIIRSAHCQTKKEARGLITASAGNHAQGVAYAAKQFGCKATIVMPTVTPLIKVNRTKELWSRCSIFTEMFMMMPAHMHVNWQKRTDIHLYIRLMTWMLQQDRELSQWRSFKELPTVDYILVPIGGGGLMHRCFHTCQDAESKDQSNRCRAGRSSQYDSSPEGREKSVDTSISANTIADGTAVKASGR